MFSIGSYYFCEIVSSSYKKAHLLKNQNLSEDVYITIYIYKDVTIRDLVTKL